MKTSLLSLVCLLALGAGVATTTPGCAGTATRKSTGEYIDDAAITTKVKTALVADELVSALDVNVDTYRGTVQLSGFVDTPVQKQRAASVAAGVNGVRNVENRLTVKNAANQ